jgi:tryptophan-rich sensory protein
MCCIPYSYLIIPAIALVISFLGGHYTRAGMGWYDSLVLPSLTPPKWVFGPVWTIIYILTALAALKVWNTMPRNCRFRNVMILFVINACANGLWSYLFFAQHDLAWAFFDALIIALTAWALIVLLWNAQRTAAYMLLPYALWSSFAAYLAYAIASLNGAW